LTIEYAGTRYSGWQKQKNARTVQGELERAIAEATGQRAFEFQGSGRTDAGVHALHQVAHLDVRTSPTPTHLLRRLNEALPADINVLSVAPASPRFHARHSAVARSYLYQVSRRRTAFAKPFVWWVKDPLDIERMRHALASIHGLHDFRAFTDDDPDVKSTEVLIDELEVMDAGDLVLIRIGGSHFIWKMVRRIVGVLVEVGRAGLPPSQLLELVQPGGGDTTSVERTPQRKTPAELTAPASGLFLERVFYEGDDRRRPVVSAVPVVTEGGSPTRPSAHRRAAGRHRGAP
jgi:tRNA pseudouridine38-40 synthase